MANPTHHAVNRLLLYKQQVAAALVQLRTVHAPVAAAAVDGAKVIGDQQAPHAVGVQGQRLHAALVAHVPQPASLRQAMERLASIAMQRRPLTHDGPLPISSACCAAVPCLLASRHYGAGHDDAAHNATCTTS